MRPETELKLDKIFIDHSFFNKMIELTYPIVKNKRLEGRWARYRIINFVLKFKKENVQNWPVRNISLGWDWFNYHAINRTLSKIAELLYLGFTPVVDTDNAGKWKWEDFFDQPFDEILDEKYISCDGNVGVYKWHGSYLGPGHEKDMLAWCKLYKDFYRFNKKTQEYVDNEYREILGNGRDQKTLGVLVRGTDFDLKPKGHFIQPPIETVIEEVKGLIGSGRYRYIYLATEDERLAEIIKAKFKGIVIENEREYYGELFRDIQETSIGYVRNNMTDEGSRKKDLSYASSINLLAHCAGLVAGNCGGSQAAVCINGLKYEYRHVYDIGLYT